MDKLIIQGESDLFGSIDIPGSKNATLPILVASLLSEKNLNLTNIPKLQDVKSMILLLRSFGVKINENNSKLTLNAKNLKNNIADYDLVRKMRASILVLGPLLARFKKAKISLPGGCSIGTRPIDIHLNSLNKLGINFEIENGFISGLVKNELIGNIIDLPFPSVGATENIMMAAILAKGKTIINNAAKEPEIIDLGDCLNSMGAKIIGQGTNTINIEGVNSLHDSSYDIMFDRIVAGTYVLAGVMINKKFTVKNIKSKYLESLIQTLIKMKANLMVNDNDITILPSKKIIGINIETAPYPGFPTDLQAQIMALMCMANGPSTIKEKIFENRFMHVSELNR